MACKWHLTNRCNRCLTRHALLLLQKHTSPQTPLSWGVGRHQDRGVQENSDFVTVAAAAVRCRHCFGTCGVEPAVITYAQPRWVGPSYSSTKPRVLFVLINPGSGSARPGAPDLRFQELLRAFAAGTGALASVLEHQGRHMHLWGRGRYAQFYLNGPGLKASDIAFENIAWCSTRGNRYPGSMLDACFKYHTLPLVSALCPDVVFLSGSSTHRYASRIRTAHPSMRVEPMLHYAHREGRQRDAVEFERVRAIVNVVQQNVASSVG